jgi:hypothetical protein
MRKSSASYSRPWVGLCMQRQQQVAPISVAASTPGMESKPPTAGAAHRFHALGLEPGRPTACWCYNFCSGLGLAFHILLQLSHSWSAQVHFCYPHPLHCHGSHSIATSDMIAPNVWQLYSSVMISQRSHCQGKPCSSMDDPRIPMLLLQMAPCRAGTACWHPPLFLLFVLLAQLLFTNDENQK